MLYNTPEAVIGEAAFGDKTMDMGVPLQRASESVKDADETRNKIFGSVDLVEHAKDDTSDGNKKAVEERAVFEKEMAQLLIDSENTMPVGALNQFKSHGIGTLLRVFDTAGRAETAFAAERNELQHPTFGAGVHSAAKRRVTTVNHLVDVRNDGLTGM